jgi:hypothetical protein
MPNVDRIEFVPHDKAKFMRLSGAYVSKGGTPDGRQQDINPKAGGELA